MPKTQSTAEMIKLDIGEVLYLDQDVHNVRFNVEWMTKVFGVVCDLDFALAVYDERVRSSLELALCHILTNRSISIYP